ncbi:MAG TPA: NAD(P)-binding domain-containing protein [Firmicutes bacterium]|nr:NAD(P)-binding domain-containing protein [Bacillota bacterium]
MRRFGVIGAGNGGQSMAGDLVLRGVNLSGIYDCNPAPIEAIRQRGGIKMSGPVMAGFAEIRCATTDVRQVVDSSDVLLVAVPANAHEAVAEQVAPHLRAGQVVTLFPGYVGGTLVFRKILDRYPNTRGVVLAEAISMPYATRLIEPAHAGIKARKKALPVAAFPATDTPKAVDALNEAFPEVIAWEDVLTVGLNNPNPMLHVVKYIFNLGRIESPEVIGADFHSWKSPTIDRIEHLAETERLSVIQAMGLRPFSVEEFEQLAYGGVMFKPLPQTRNIPASASQAPDRFITEDVPMGLVPIAGFGRMFGVPTPTIDFLIDTASFIRETDYRKTGRTPESLGLAGMDASGIATFVRCGAA